MITIIYNTFVGITAVGRGSTVQRHSILIAQAVFEGWKRVEFHQLRVSTLDLGLATLLHVFNVRLKVAFHAKGLWCQGHQELPKRLNTLIAPPLVTLVLGLGAGFLQLVLRSFFLASKASFSFFTFSQ